MVLKINVLTAILVLLLPSLLVMVEGRGKIADVVHHHNETDVGSPWLKNEAKRSRPRQAGCRRRPWICKGRETPGMRMSCCGNQCVDVFSDRENCGLCSFRCPFTMQCCRGFCSNIYRSPVNCGRCGNRCPCRVKCRYGMCGYAAPWPCPPQPPRPWPPHPPWPLRPPFPPRPPCPPYRRCPPRPPYGDQPPPMSTEDL